MRHLTFILLLAIFCSTCQQNPVVPAPTACFSATPTSCLLGDCTISFDAACSRNAVSYSWDFGDNTATASGRTTTHSYERTGIFTIILTATNENGENNSTNQRITVDENPNLPIADFSIQNSGCFAPCQVTFSNISENATRFEWDFGDGNTSTAFSPAHTYAVAGEYIVSLKASNDDGENMVSKPITIRTLTFSRLLEGGRLGNVGNCGQETSDSGYIVLGTTNSAGTGNEDMYLIKTDNEGNQQWTRTFGGVSTDFGSAVQQTTDGGYILLGSTFSEGVGGSDIYLAKVDNIGNLIWTRTIGGQEDDFGVAIQQTNDGSFILLGNTESEGAGNSDIYLAKVDDIGNLIWTQTIGTQENDFGAAIQQTNDGGFIVLGTTTIDGTNNSDMYLIKTDDAGNAVWLKTFGGMAMDVGTSVQQTTEGGYIVLGYTSDATDSNILLLKTDAQGNAIWSKTFDGSIGYSVAETTDGGYVLLGWTDAEGTDAIYLLKTDTFGDLEWQKTFGNFEQDRGYHVQQTTDGGYILFCDRRNESNNTTSIYLIKTDAEGNVN